MIVNVNFIVKPLKAYCIILAQIPKEWVLDALIASFFIPFICPVLDYILIFLQKPVPKDIAKCGHTTTIGPSQFHEFTMNHNLTRVVDHPLGGRPSKV